MATTSNNLSNFLRQNREKYLEALKTGKSKEWTVVVGNEAGDLDTAASSIAYSYIASTFVRQPSIALLQTPRTDLPLRAENLYAYELARLSPNKQELLCIDDIPSNSLSQVLNSSFALVDHNRLPPRFIPETGSPPRVVAVIDHHDDEGLYPDADPRVIAVPVGSCSSLVTRHFMPLWEKATTPPPPEVATLLLSAILIDTHGLQAGNKAVEIDHSAANFLLPRSTFALASSNSFDGPDLLGIINTLGQRKGEVSHLSSRDLLRRDYKEYTIASSSKSYKVGIATVPLNLNLWVEKDSSPGFWNSMDAWILERELDTLGVLCTYRSAKEGKHKRQMIWIVADGRESLRKALWKGLEENDELRLQVKNMKEQKLSKDIEMHDGDIRTDASAVARIWKQKNARVTRKMVAPLVKSIIEAL
ncbi:DHH phosphoesterase [Hysterangium stoloniferum]|nr:DHH phosphoesterase [Hysterangium stoloniferum]